VSVCLYCKTPTAPCGGPRHVRIREAAIGIDRNVQVRPVASVSASSASGCGRVAVSSSDGYTFLFRRSADESGNRGWCLWAVLYKNPTMVWCHGAMRAA